MLNLLCLVLSLTAVGLTLFVASQRIRHERKRRWRDGQLRSSAEEFARLAA